MTINNNSYCLKEMFENDINYVTEFSIINCGDVLTINNNQEIAISDNGSFEIDFIFTKKNNYIMKKKKILKENYPLLDLNKYFNEQKILMLYVKTIQDYLNDPTITRSKFSKLLSIEIEKLKNINIEHYSYFISNKIYPIEEKEYQLLLNYTIYLISLKVNETTEAYFLFKTYFKQLKDLEAKLKNDTITRKDVLSFSLWFKNNYTSNEVLKKCLDCKIEKYEEIYDNCTDEWLDYEIIFIKEINSKCAYSKAFEFLLKVISNLKNDSKLLEILYLIDSGTGETINEKKKIDRTFNLSLISKETIISHIKQIIPHMIVRKREKIKSIYFRDGYAEFDIFSGLIIFYEETLFHQEMEQTKILLLDNPDEKNIYVIPIFLILLHEICSHSKLELRNYLIQSPNIIRFNYHREYNDL